MLVLFSFQQYICIYLIFKMLSKLCLRKLLYNITFFFYHTFIFRLFDFDVKRGKNCFPHQLTFLEEHNIFSR